MFLNYPLLSRLTVPKDQQQVNKTLKGSHEFSELNKYPQKWKKFLFCLGEHTFICIQAEAEVVPSSILVEVEVEV